MVFLLYRVEGWMTLRFVEQNTGIKASVRKAPAPRRATRSSQRQAPAREAQTLLPPHLGSGAAKKPARSSPGWRRVCSHGEERARQLRMSSSPPGPVAGRLAGGAPLVPREEGASTSSKEPEMVKASGPLSTCVSRELTDSETGTMFQATGQAWRRLPGLSVSR